MRFQSRGYKVFEDIEDIRSVLMEQREALGEAVDFYLLDVKTFYAKKDSQEFKPIVDVNIFNKNSNYIANVILKQTYSIEICKKTQKPPRSYGFKLFDGENTILRTMLVCNQIQYQDNLKDDLYQELYKTMILQGYLVGIREYGKLSSQLEEFTQRVKNNQYPPKLVLNIGVGVSPNEGKSGELKIYHSLKDTSSANSKEGFIPKICTQSVHKGDLLFEYTKPIQGNNGRDLKGVLLTIPNITNICPNIDNNSIRLRESPQTIKYYAAKDGFLLQKTPNSFTLTDEINQTRGADTKKSISIDGQTHKQSKIQTDTAYIGAHRGSIKAEIAVIDVLEKGSVEAKVAYINSALGGTIVADYIYIKEVRSYNVIYPRYSLVIDKIIGEHNTFEIDPTRLAFSRKDRVVYMSLSEQIRLRLKHLRQTLDEIYAYLLASQSKVHKIKYDNQDKELPKNLQTVVEQYDAAVERYRKHLQEYADIANLYYTNEIKLKSINECALNASIIIREEISSAETIIIFKVLSGNHQEVLKTILSTKKPAKRFNVISEGDFYRLRAYQNFDNSHIEWIERLRPPNPQ